MLRSCKTASAVICIILALFCCMAPKAYAASWTTLVPADYIADTYYTGNFRHVVIDFERTPLVSYGVGATTGTAMGSASVMGPLEGSSIFTYSIYPLGVRNVGGPPLTNSASGAIAIDASDLKPSAAFSVIADFGVEVDISHWSEKQDLSELVNVSVTWNFSAYSSTGTYLGSIERHSENRVVQLLDYDHGVSFVYNVPVNLAFSLSEITEKVAYIVPVGQVKVSLALDDPAIYIDYIKMTSDGFSLTTRTDMLLQDSQTLKAIEDQLGEVNDKLDQIIDQPDSEKQEALEDGNSYVEDLTDVIPDQSAGFMSGIKKLANSMSYEGTDAALKLPSIALPAIPGVMDSYKLTDEMDIDFGSWIQKMPETLLTLVQVLLTIALVVFAFKELYKMISYALTLKSGGGD